MNPERFQVGREVSTHKKPFAFSFPAAAFCSTLNSVGQSP